MICPSPPQVEKLLPKESFGGPRSLQSSRRWLPRAGSDGVGQVSPTFLLPGSPHTLQAPLQQKAFLWYLEKSCGRRGRAAAGSSHWEALGSRCSLPLLRSFQRIASYWGKTDFGVEGRGWRGTDEICGWSSGVWLMRNPRGISLALASSLKTGN